MDKNNMNNSHNRAVAGLILAFVISLSLIGVLYSQLQANRNQAIETNKRADNARAGELAGQSLLLDMNDGAKMIQSGLLAVEAAKYGPSLQANQALRRYLDLAALPIAKVSHGVGTNVYVAYSPDGKYVVSGDRDSVEVWEAQNGHIIANMPFYYTSSVAFSPDGKYVAAGALTENGEARVWEVSSGREIVSQSFGAWVGFVAFSPDGKYVAWSGGSTIRVWDVKRAQEVVQMPHQSVYFITFSPDGKYLLSSGYDRTARVWDVESGSEVLKLAHNGLVKKAIFSPDGKYITSASDDKMLRIWNANSGQVVFEKYNDSDVNDIAFSPDGRFLAVGLEEGTVMVWSISYGNEIARMSHRHSVNSVVFSPDGRYIASSSYGDARIWLAMTGRDVAHFDDATIVSIDFSPDGKYVATGGCESLTYYQNGQPSICQGIARVWEVSNGRVVFDIPQRNSQYDYGNIHSVMYNPLNSSYVLTGNSDGYARVWNTRSGQEVFRIRLGDDRNPVYAAFSPNGKYILARSTVEASIWDAQNGTEISHKDHLEGITAMAFSPNSEIVVSGSWDGTIIVWEAKSGREIARMAQIIKWESLTFSPDGKYVAAIDSVKDGVLPKEGIIRIWEVSNGQEITRITYPSQVDTIVFSPDGKYIALSGFTDPLKPNHKGMVSIREVLSGSEIARYFHPYRIYSMIFTSNNKYLITDSADSHGTIVMWNVQTGKEAARILSGAPFWGSYSLSLSHDDRYLITSGYSIRLWDLQSDRPQIEVLNELTNNITFITHTNYLQSKDKIFEITFSNLGSSKFSSDGRYILTTGCDFNQYGVCNEQHVFILYWRIEDLIAETCRRLPRNFTQSEWVQYFPNEEYRATCPNLSIEP
jgi:WD40 repeat protein